MPSVRMTADEVAQNIANLSRHPFQKELIRHLMQSPSEEAIAGEAERSPNKYWNTVATIAKLAGYNDRLEVEASFQVEIGHWSDAELLQAIESKAIDLPCYREDKGDEAKQDQ